MATALPKFLDHPVKESRGRVNISSESRPVYGQSIFIPSILVRDWRNVQWDFVVAVKVVLLTGLGSTWTGGQLSCSGTLECVWLLGLSGNDGTRS